MTIPYPHIPPVIFAVGPVAIRWYGVMYAVGYMLGYRLARTRTARRILPIDRSTLDAWIGYLVIGMLVGARLVYAAVYDRPAFARDPLELFRIWHGGLSFHGAVLGMTIACAIFASGSYIIWPIASPNPPPMTPTAAPIKRPSARLARTQYGSQRLRK